MRTTFTIEVEKDSKDAFWINFITQTKSVTDGPYLDPQALYTALRIFTLSALKQEFGDDAVLDLLANTPPQS